VDRVIESGETALLPVQREVTLLFSDIRGFTTLSETPPPQQVLALLDDYFGHMTQIVMARGGMVNKFLGDGMLARWGVPDHAWREQNGEPPAAHRHRAAHGRGGGGDARRHAAARVHPHRLASESTWKRGGAGFQVELMGEEAEPRSPRRAVRP